MSFRYEGLGVKEILQLLTDRYPMVYQYLPEPELELPKTPKQWIGNVCASILQSSFSNWVKEQVETRHDKAAVKKDLMINMDPEIAKIFQESTAVSSKCYHPINRPNLNFFYSQQGLLRKHAPSWQQAASHQETDRGGEAGGYPQEAADRGQARQLRGVAGQGRHDGVREGQ